MHDTRDSEGGNRKSGIGQKHYFAEIMIRNRKGLHARASAQFVKCVEKFDATVHVTREGHTVLGTSIMGLMMLAAAQGNTILVETKGTQARDVLDALITLIEARFNEES